MAHRASPTSQDFPSEKLLLSHHEAQDIRGEDGRGLLARHVSPTLCYREEARCREAKQLAVSVSGFKGPGTANVG